MEKSSKMPFSLYTVPQIIITIKLKNLKIPY